MSNVFKRKFRWLLEVVSAEKTILPKSFVKIHSRPNHEDWVDQATQDKIRWGETVAAELKEPQTITVTIFEAKEEYLQCFWDYLSEVYSLKAGAVERKDPPKMVALNLDLLDGCGVEIERWNLFDAWPEAINFGELDHSSTEEVTIEITFRYSKFQYTNCCISHPAPTTFSDTAAHGRPMGLGELGCPNIVFK